MLQYSTGVHTIEIQAMEQISLASLPTQYRAAIKPEGGKRYRLTIPRLPDMGEYNGVQATQEALERALEELSKTGGYCKVTRIDYRLDDHRNAYADMLPMMRVLVNLTAFAVGMQSRVASFADNVGEITSIRCMPEDGKTGEYGVEYYDKERQKGTQEYGRARLELRRMNLSGESVQGVLREWGDILRQIDKQTFESMLEAHSRAILQRKKEGESAREFIRRVKPDIIAAREEGIILKRTGTQRNHYQCTDLPKWEDVKAQLDVIISHICQDLTDSQTKGENFLPF